MFRRQPTFFLPAAAVAASLAVAGLSAVRPAAAQTPAAAEDESGDPYENTNRAIFTFNQGVDRAILVPVASTYRAVLPGPIRDSVHDFLQNLNSPIIFANDVLQGRFDLAGDTLGRFVVNTTLGFGGIVDVATKAGVPYHTNDLGITLATWGVPDGPYLMLPVLGPSNPRDLFGDVADNFGDPGNIVASDHHKLYASFARGVTSGIDERSRNIESLAEIERTSLDYYATIRSLARQRRAAQIRHQKEDVPNATPLQGASAIPHPAPVEAVAEMRRPMPPPMSYRMATVQPGSVSDMHNSPMAPSGR
jgi:phospholipid-binding lipoprotein MlaA